MSRLTKVGLVLLVLSVALTALPFLGISLPSSSSQCPAGFDAGNCGDADFSGIAYFVIGVPLIAISLAVLAVAGLRRLFKKPQPRL